MGKQVPYLYRKLAFALQEQEQRIAIKREMRRRAVFEAICNAIRIRNAERREIFREMQEMGLLKRRGQRRMTLR